MSVIVRGFPSDINSSFLNGCAKAPEQIRTAFFSDSSNLASESAIDLSNIPEFIYLEELSLGESSDFKEQILQTSRSLISSNTKLISIGGDHSITFPLIESIKSNHDNFTIVHFDAHPDLYENFENNPFSHASPFARIKENFPEIDLIQIGIRTINTHQKSQIDRYNVTVFSPDKFDELLKLEIDGPIYISIDMDGFDPAFAPGVSHIEPGGLTSRQVINWIQSVPNEIIGADIVEYNPDRDVNHMTAFLAAKLIKELAVKMI